jgi:hypothetical protein
MTLRHYFAITPLLMMITIIDYAIDIDYYYAIDIDAITPLLITPLRHYAITLILMILMPLLMPLRHYDDDA